MRRTLPFFVFVVLAPAAVRAQDTKTPDPEPTPHISPALGVHYGTPLRFSASAGVLVDMSEHRNDGVVATVEIGQQGNEISAGYFRMLGRFGSGYSLRLAAVRTVGEPWNASPNTTYAGVEGSWMIAFGVGARVGFLRRTSKSHDFDPHPSLASLGVQIGI
ncbi:MAG: hypothetical protein ABJE10_05550 [bacterium]